MSSSSFIRTFLCAAIVVSAAAAVVSAQEEQQKQPASAPASQPSEPVDFRKLKELLPAELAGIKRTDAKGERTAFGELKLSVARGEYYKEVENGDSPSINIEITDFGATKGMAEAMTYWTQLDIDQEGDGGYEKSKKINGHAALEKFQTEGKSGSLQIFVANRFLVNITSNHVGVEEFRKIGEALKLDDLAALK
jgi:hypothetical protein